MGRFFENPPPPCFDVVLGSIVLYGDRSKKHHHSLQGLEKETNHLLDCWAGREPGSTEWGRWNRLGRGKGTRKYGLGVATEGFLENISMSFRGQHREVKRFACRGQWYIYLASARVARGNPGP